MTEKNDFEPKIIGFLCNWCSYAGADLALPTRLFVQKEMDILGSRNATAEDFSEVIDYLEQGDFPLDAVISLVREHQLAAEDIHTVDVFTFERTLRLNNYADPDTLEGAQYSLPFCLAAVAVGGAQALMPLAPDWLHRPDIVALARRVDLHVDSELDARFPAETGARVRLQTAGGVLEQTVRHPLGDPANPMNRALLVAKFKKLAAGVIAKQNQDALLTLIDQLADLADTAQIVDCLRGPDAGGGPHKS